jgi:hypothetical protein
LARSLRGRHAEGARRWHELSTATTPPPFSASYSSSASRRVVDQSAPAQWRTTGARLSICSILKESRLAEPKDIHVGCWRETIPSVRLRTSVGFERSPTAPPSCPACCVLADLSPTLESAGTQGRQPTRGCCPGSAMRYTGCIRSGRGLFPPRSDRQPPLSRILVLATRCGLLLAYS